MTKKLIISFAVVGTLVLALTFGAYLLPSDNTNIITSTFRPIAPCACITVDAELWWDVENQMETYFTPNHEVDRVTQVLYNPGADLLSSENMLFAVAMNRVDGLGDKFFIVEYGGWEILDIIAVPNVIGNSDNMAEVITVRGVRGNLLQVHTADHRVKLITFDKEHEIIGEFEIVGQRRNGDLELREIVESEE